MWNDKFSEASSTPNNVKTVHNTVQCVVILTTVIFGSFMGLVRTCLLGEVKEHAGEPEDEDKTEEEKQDEGEDHSL